MNYLDKFIIFTKKFLTGFDFIYRKNKQGMYQVNYHILGIFALMILLIIGLNICHSFKNEKIKKLIKDIENAELINNEFSDFKRHNNSKEFYEDSKKSIIGYLSIEGFYVKNFSNIQNQNTQTWKLDGELNKDSLSKFLSYLDKDEGLLNITELSIEQIEEEKHLKVSMSGKSNKFQLQQVEKKE